MDLPREEVQRLLAIGVAMDQGHSMFVRGLTVEPALNTRRMASEMLSMIANEGYRHAEDMSADVSRFAVEANKYRVALHALAHAVRKDPMLDMLKCSSALFTALGVAEDCLSDDNGDARSLTDQEWEDFARAAGFEP